MDSTETDPLDTFTSIGVFAARLLDGLVDEPKMTTAPVIGRGNRDRAIPLSAVGIESGGVIKLDNAASWPGRVREAGLGRNRSVEAQRLVGQPVLVAWQRCKERCGGERSRAGNEPARKYQERAHADTEGLGA